MKNTLAFLDNTIKENTSIVLGLSGGPDSMCLFHMLLQFKSKKNITIICAHVNHNIRSESDSEEQFVKHIVEENNCIFETIKLEFKTKKNFENLARKERYAFFNKIVDKYQAEYLMTAHHGDDLMETILMHLTRGSNLNGYAGFKKITTYSHYQLIRPLVYMTKEEIINYCKANHIKYCVDSSNESDAHTRNRFRKNVLPFLKEENKSVHLKFLKFSEELEQIEEYLEKTTKIALTNVYDFGKVNLHEFNKLDLLMKKRVVEYILKEEYQDDIYLLNDKHIKAILKMCSSLKPNSKIELPLRKTLIREYDSLYFDYKKKDYCQEYTLEEYLKYSESEEFIKLASTEIEKSNYIIRLNSNEIALPLKVRTRKEKDTMQVKNLKGTKKIKDIFIDEKVPKNRRETIPIVVDQNDTILWLPGLKKSKFDKNKDEFYDIIYKYVISEEKKDEKK